MEIDNYYWNITKNYEDCRWNYIYIKWRGGGGGGGRIQVRIENMRIAFIKNVQGINIRTYNYFSISTIYIDITTFEVEESLQNGKEGSS